MRTRNHPILSFVAGLALALGIVGLLTTLRHRPEPVRPPRHSVTASFGGAPLWVVLKSLFRMEARNLPHRYDETVPDVAIERPIQVALNQSGFGDALARVLNEAQPGLFYSVQNGVYVISYDAGRRRFAPLPVPLHPETPLPSNRIRHDAPLDTRLLRRRVSLNVTNMELRQALQSVLAQASVDYALALPSPFPILTTKHLRNVPMEAALDTLLAEAHKRDQNLNYRWQGNVLTVYVDAVSYFAEPAFDPETVRVDCRFQQARLFDASVGILRGSGRNWTVDPQRHPDRVTLTLSGASPLDALNALGRAASGKLATHLEGDITHVVLHSPRR